ncbi:hypothetical protein BDP27DRAFT_1485759 [Rhodocollybia butyracea]|uniref:Uncharacterized protein n=1 Tax=Rhodocollybia butyracea TaxID=206335 RepID=A0A9P5PFD2_9AGAR|nr:hypothetical protein BDP27DRAFT_1485759 [Rhodocollybia butyracea]
MSSMISFRARPGATVRVVQTESGTSLHMEDSGVSRSGSGTGNDLDIQVELSANGLSLCVVPTPEPSPLGASPPLEIFPSSSGKLDWGFENQWPLSANCTNALDSFAEKIGIDILFENDHESFPSSAMIEPGHFSRTQAIFDYNDAGSFTDESSDSGSPGPDEFTNASPNGSSSVSRSPTISPNPITDAQPKKNTQYPCMKFESMATLHMFCMIQMNTLKASTPAEYSAGNTILRSLQSISAVGLRTHTVFLHKYSTAAGERSFGRDMARVPNGSGYQFYYDRY